MGLDIAKDTFVVVSDETTDQRHHYRGLARDPASSQDVQLSAVPQGEKPVAYLSFNRNGYSTCCRVFREYHDWVAKRNAERYQNTVQHGKNYDAKNMLHVFRLLCMADEIARTSQLHVRRPDREFLLAIRRGEFECDDLVVQAEALIVQVDTAFAAASLPAAPDKAAAEARLVQVRQAWHQAAQTARPLPAQREEGPSD